MFEKLILRNSKQSGRILCLIAMLIFGCFSITATCLIVRSEKKTEIEDALTMCGDYDVIAYETPIGFEDNFLDSEFIDDVGLYYELGMVTNLDERETFKAVSLKDELSEEMYHLTCIRGCFPKSNNEIAVDISVAYTFGVAPYPGEEISLKLLDFNGRYIGEKKYVISGVFRLINNHVYGGWNRASLDSIQYEVPAVFFYPSDLDSWNCTKETVFFRAYSKNNTELKNEVRRIITETGQSCSGIEYNERRSGVLSWFVGLNDDDYYGLSLEKRFNDVSEGLYKKDFYSEIVFPIISLLILIIESVSIYMISKNIIADRKDRYAILRSVGMSSKRIIGNLLMEILGIGVVGAIIGICLGYATHLTIINLFNRVWNLQLYDGIHVEKVIKQITYDPIVASIVVSVCALAVSLIIPLYRLYKMYPAELLTTSDGVFVKKEKKRKIKTTSLKGRWLGLLNKRIELHDGCTMLIMMIVLAAALFGYVFFRAFSDQATGEDQGYKQMMGFDGDGYVVCKSSDLRDLGNNVYNRHDAGIVPTFPELIENNSNVERVWSIIMNESTRIVFDQEPNDGMKQLLGNRSLNYKSSDDPWINEEKVAEASIFGHMGYEMPVYMYELPTVGLTVNEMNALNGDVLSGQINIDKIKSGEEVVLAVPDELKDLCQQYFPVGSNLGFDDILLTEEEEKLDKENCLDEKWVVYDNYIETDVGQAHVGYTSFGTRYGVETKVGAIVVLHEEKAVSEYLTSGSEWVKQLYFKTDSDSDNSEPTYGVSVLCLPESFEAWGLPDRNFTSVKVELKKNYDVYEFDDFWYKSLSGSIDVTTNSTFDYADKITITTNRIMTIFFMLLLDLIVLGVVSIIVGLYTKTRSNLARFQTLRRIGLSVRQASIMIYTQNMYYPLFATITAIIPICIVQKILDSCEAKIAGDQFDILAKPWYVRMPYWANLFSYDFIPALICCLLLGFLLIFIGTLPQILYLRKMKMIETREE